MYLKEQKLTNMEAVQLIIDYTSEGVRGPRFKSWMSPHVLECICIFTFHLVLHLTVYIDCTFAYHLLISVL